MDKFTENILQEWEFAELIERFKGILFNFKFILKAQIKKIRP